MPIGQPTIHTLVPELQRPDALSPGRLLRPRLVQDPPTSPQPAVLGPEGLPVVVLVTSSSSEDSLSDGPAETCPDCGCEDYQMFAACPACSPDKAFGTSSEPGEFRTAADTP